jgi:hypothetical protein
VHLAAPAVLELCFDFTFEVGVSLVWQTDENDRPLDPPRITATEIIWNPFEDIVPRTTPEEQQALAAKQRYDAPVPASFSACQVSGWLRL